MTLNFLTNSVSSQVVTFNLCILRAISTLHSPTLDRTTYFQQDLVDGLLCELLCKLLVQLGEIVVNGNAFGNLGICRQVFERRLDLKPFAMTQSPNHTWPPAYGECLACKCDPLAIVLRATHCAVVSGILTYVAPVDLQ